MRDVVKSVIAVYGGDIEEIADTLKPCEYCEIERDDMYILRERLPPPLIGLREDDDLTNCLTAGFRGTVEFSYIGWFQLFEIYRR